MPPCQDALADFPVINTIPVRWGDMDSLGHVNNTVYLVWAETCRVDYMLRIGMWQGLAAEQVGPILASISCDFRRPADYPDTIRVGARVTSMGNSSFRMAHTIWSEKLGAVVAEIDSAIVLFDYRAGKSVRIPDRLRQAIRDLENKDVPGL
jgi:acyl-CoA thioester hydrolase